MTININQIIGDGYNSNYMSGLIISLFNDISFDYLLNIIPNNYKFIYIQEYIKTNILYSFRNGYSINSEYFNELRNYINFIGWSKSIDDFLELRSIYDFYIFFISNILKDKIKFIAPNENNKEEILSTFIIDLKFDNINNIVKNNVVNINELFKNWIKTTILNKNNNYILETLPKLLPFYLHDKPDNIKINIMHKIKLFHNDNKLQNNIRWDIYSLICKNKKGYYSIIQYNKKWFLISDKLIPSVKEIKMNNKNIVNMISTEVLIIFYKLE